VGSSHLDGLAWFRSNKCDAGACVEIAALAAEVLIRDSAEPGNTPLAVSRDVWQDFVFGVRAGVFDER
jgi:Domain of unknown function (DUF397)